MGTEKDPEHEDKTGSNPLRLGCPTDEDLRRGFSLVYLSRTVSVAGCHSIILYIVLYYIVPKVKREANCGGFTSDFSSENGAIL